MTLKELRDRSAAAFDVSDEEFARIVSDATAALLRDDRVKACQIGVETERAAIVAWLRKASKEEHEWSRDVMRAGDMADAIEAGEHLK